tara:strand:- start:1220 stop:1687 length:468 start_codon:yes stop_codon:yes gene_type:complete
MKGPEDSKIDKFWKAEIRRLEEEFENDITPTVEKTRSAASTTGRTRSQRSAVLTPKSSVCCDTVLPRGQTKGRTVSVPTVPGVSIVASPFNDRAFKVTPMTDLAHSGTGRGKHSRDLKRHERGTADWENSVSMYEGTPNTAETRSETMPAPRRSI